MSSPASSPTILPAAQGGLQAEGLACRRGDRLLFRGLDLCLEAGQILWLRGANGRGKTSLLRLLSGLSTPAEGEIRWNGRSLRAAGADFRRQLLFIGHQNGLKDDLSATEALQFLARIHGLPSSTAEVIAALQAMAIGNRRNAPVRTLSQGQRRRVALARLALDLAVPGRAGLWLLDEPYDALDAQGITSLDGVLSAHARRGGSIVLTSHLALGLTEPQPRVLHLDTHQTGALQTPASAESAAA